MAESEPVTSPDQHKPVNRKAWRFAAIFTAAVLLLIMITENEISWLERLWLIGISGGLLAIIIGDAVLRRMGLRS
ncbi:MAG TPA: hypothetical protein VFX60_11550 [Micromonospora sp.]|nr:hypothetical protein [Micromonospora sp.]